jgi:predicted dehydrogenase
MKALFCGLGSIGQRHLRNLRSLLGESVDVIAYRTLRSTPVLNADMTVRQGATLESEYAVRSFNNLDEALSEKPDVAFITNPNSLHLPVALAAARAGCHLFIEKPISHSLVGIDDLVHAIDSQHLVAFVAYQFRFHPGLKLIKSLIEENELGRLASAYVVNAEYLPNWHPYEDYRQSHAARRELGGGCLSIQTHEIDYAMWLFGMPKRVFAVGGHLSDLDVDVEDSVSLLLECDSAGRGFPVNIHLDYLQQPPQRICEVVGDKGKARYDYYTNTVEVSQSGETETHRFTNFDRNQMFIDELKHFIACVRREAEPVVNVREGIASMEIAQAAYESLRTGKAVEIGQ